jgi:hypothetical protein
MLSVKEAVDSAILFDSCISHIYKKMVKAFSLLVPG